MKRYIIPTTAIIVVSTQAHLLGGSPNAGDIGGSTPGIKSSRRRGRRHDQWEDEDDWEEDTL